MEKKSTWKTGLLRKLNFTYFLTQTLENTDMLTNELSSSPITSFQHIKNRFQSL